MTMRITFSGAARMGLLLLAAALLAAAAWAASSKSADAAVATAPALAEAEAVAIQFAPRAEVRAPATSSAPAGCRNPSRTSRNTRVISRNNGHVTYEQDFRWACHPAGGGTYYTNWQRVRWTT